MFFKKDIQKYLLWAGYFVVLAAIALIGHLVISQEVEIQNEIYIEREKEVASRFNSELRAELEQELNQRLFSVAALKGFVIEDEYDIEERSFQIFAETLTESAEGIRSLQLAPDAVVTHVYPLEGNEAVLGYDLLAEDVNKEIIQRSIDNDEYVIVGPIELLQGGEALIARLPIYYPQNSDLAVNRDRFWGFATVLIDTEILYEVIEENNREREYKIALRGVNGEGESGEVFYGDQSVFGQNPVINSVELPTGSWQIAVIPNEGWSSSVPSTLFFQIASYAVLLTIIAALLLTGLYIRSQLLLTSKDYEVQAASLKSILPSASLILILVIFGGLTWGAIFLAQSILNTQAQDQFEERALQVAEDVVDRSAIYIAALEGGRGLLSASETVERNEWRTYIDSLNIQENYPGIQGIGYAIFVEPEDKADHEAAIQAEGFPEYVIRPPGERSIYTAIIYLEPFDERNRQAFGFDMYQEANRKAAMQQARDTARVAMSQKITLVQEIDDDVQAGFLIYIPYYENGIEPNSVAERRNSIVGYVYSPFRARDFIEGIIGVEGFDTISLKIYDGDVGDEDNVIYDDTDKNPALDLSRFTMTVPVSVANHEWNMVFYSDQEYGLTPLNTSIPIGIAALGTLITILFIAVFYSLSSARKRATLLAKRITRKLEKNQQRLETFNKIITLPSLSFDERVKKILQLATNELGMELGIVSEIDGERYRVKHFYSKDKKGISKGSEFKLKDTYCKEVHSEGKLVSIHHAGQSEYSDHPCYKSTNLEAYIGVPVAIGGQEYGTLNFSSSKPLVSPFTTEDKQFVQLVGLWLGRVLSDQEVDRAKSEFVSIASHQLRTPLNAIGWNAELLQTEYKKGLNEDQKELLTDITKGNERMVELVDSLLNVSRIELGRFKVTPSDVVPADVVEEILKELRGSIKKKNLKIKKDFKNETEVFKADRNLLTIIIQNLLSNAVKYTPEGGTITITLQLTKNQFLFRVSDTGYGIPKKDQSYVFSKFHRSENVQEKGIEGTGLGLYIIRAIIKSTGGKISFKSVENKGTDFRVVYPRKGMKKREGSKNLTPTGGTG